MAGAALVVDLFAVRWYQAQPGGIDISGWDGLTISRWVFLLAAAAGIALAVTQAGYRAPALPSTIAVFTTVLGLIATVVAFVRVVLDPPGSNLDRCAGGYVGLAACALLFLGGLWSLRQEGILERDGPGEIPTVSI